MNPPDPSTYRISQHTRKRAEDRGIAFATILAVIRNPDIQYASRHKDFPNQRRLIGAGICVVVDDDQRSVPTVHYHGRTDFRED